MLDRRAFLLTSAAAGAVTALPARGAPAGESPELAALFDAFFEEGLRQRPESATQLGLDKGKNADLRAKLSDASDAGRAADQALTHRPAAPAGDDRPQPAQPGRPARLRRRQIHPRLDRGGPGVRLRRRRLWPEPLCRQPADRRVPVGPRLPRHQAPGERRERRRRLSVAPVAFGTPARRPDGADEARRRDRRRAARLPARHDDDPDAGVARARRPGARRPVAGAARGGQGARRPLRARRGGDLYGEGAAGAPAAGGRDRNPAPHGEARRRRLAVQAGRPSSTPSRSTTRRRRAIRRRRSTTSGSRRRRRSAPASTACSRRRA